MWVALVIERGRNMRCVGCMVFTYLCVRGGVCMGGLGWGKGCTCSKCIIRGQNLNDILSQLFATMFPL